ncbi:alpha/beta hydrolase [Mycobacterium sp.]|uniref:alpha/beta hydrolase n=1 Tax=Mycobacterium sp. TaxID=1785 RepID=UPI002C72C127|nr:alpha/beta hydrolase [Mycobacterium sp.]HME46573.1 alpha/beta hydrolase [Mycobacterium sp.]
MPTIRLPRRAVGAALWLSYGLTLNHRLPFRIQRKMIDAIAPMQTLPTGTVTRAMILGGRPAEKVTVGADNGTAVLYLHGGGYTIGSLATHRSLAAHIARDAGAAVYVLDYRLAPEHPYPAAPDDAVAAFCDLLDNHGYTPDHVAIGGDSAGGGLSLTAARRLIDRHDVRPAALALIAPWVDPTADTARKRDLVVNARWSHACAQAYLGAGDPDDAGYAPLRANLTGLPPTLVHVGTHEVLYPQVVELVDKLRLAGVDVTFTELPQLWHVAHLQASLVKEAAFAAHQLTVFVRDALDARSGRQAG